MSIKLCCLVVLIALTSALLAGCQSTEQSQSTWNPTSGTQSDSTVISDGNAVPVGSNSANRERALRPVEAPAQFSGESIAGYPVQKDKDSVAIMSKSSGG